MKISHYLEKILFQSRWILAPLYLGLVGVLALVLYRFVAEFVNLIGKTVNGNSSDFILELLALLDLVLLANLILIVIFAGYENFVSRIEEAHDSVDRPHWMGTIDFSGLKMKLIGSLVAISVIELLKDFIALKGVEEVGEGTIYRIVIHLVFVVSGVLFAVMDYIGDLHKSEVKLLKRLAKTETGGAKKPVAAKRPARSKS
jgi:uncharacterized protein (TIGR00645 family)